MRRKNRLIAAIAFAFVAAAGLVTLPHEALAAPGASAHQHLAGRWNVNCENSRGMVVEFTIQGRRAIGKIAVLGQAKDFHYRAGETIFELNRSTKGTWQGRFLWRNTQNVNRWEPIRFVADGKTVHATEGIDPCYTHMSRAR